MKNKKWGLLIIFIMLIIVSSVVVFLILKRDNELDKKNNKLSYGIASYYNIISKQNIIDNYNKEYYIVIKNEKCGVVNNKNEEIINTKYENCEFVGNLLLTHNKDSHYIINLKNEVLFESKNYINTIKNLYNDNIYFSIIKNNKTEIYDSNLKFIRVIDEIGYFDFFDKYVIGNEYVFNLENDEKMVYDFFSYAGDYLMYGLNSESLYYVYNAKNKVLNKYTKKIENKYSRTFINDKETIIVDFKGNVITDSEKRKVFDKYYLNYALCKDGFYVTDLKGNKINDKCYVNVNEDLLDYKVLLLESVKSYDLITTDGSIVNINSSEVNNIGEFIKTFDNKTGKNDLYDIKGNQVFENCNYGIEIINNNRFICKTVVANYIVDRESKIIDGEYLSVFCNTNNACVVEDFNHRYGLKIDDKVIIEPNYLYGSINDNMVVLYDNSINTILYLDESNKILSEKDIEKTKIDDDYNSINVEQVINEYNLENIKKEIEDNKELFKKYAYIILNNKNLETYQDEVLSMFNVLVAHKDDFDERYYFDALRKLNIVTEDIETPDISGQYQGGSHSIVIETKTALFHELMHFFDYSLNYGNNTYFYSCDNEYYSLNEIAKLALSKQNKCEVIDESVDNKIIREAATEINQARYKMLPVHSYLDETYVYNALVYIYGEDFMDSVYFSTDGNGKFLKKLLDTLTYEEVVKLVNDFSRLSGNFDNMDAYVNVTNTLVKLYKKEQGSNWYDNKEFLFIISTFVGYRDKKFYNFETKYLYNFNSKSLEIINNYREKTDVYTNVPGIMIKDGKTYLNYYIKDNKNKIGTIQFIYDFDKEKIEEVVGFYPEIN